MTPVDGKGLITAIERLAVELPSEDLNRLARCVGEFAGPPAGGEKAFLAELIPTLEFQTRLGKLLEAWAGSPAVPGAAVSLALLSAARALDRREAERLEVVWTGPATQHVPLRRTDQVLLQMIDGAKSEVWLVSFAVYAVASVVDALKAARARDVRVTVVLESVLASGGKLKFDKVEEMRAALPPPTRLLTWPLERRPLSAKKERGVLHAKIAVVDRESLLVTSANLTEHALCLNMEMGLLVRGNAAQRVTEHLEGLAKDGTLRPC